jgi:signal transduction histidine kinase
MSEYSLSKITSDANLSTSRDVATLEAILFTEELYRRESRLPDYKKENSALVALAHALADSPGTILQTLADIILEVSEADSAGLSLLTTYDGGQRFYWPAIAGKWKAYIGGGTPREFGPCGDVLDHDRPLLFRHIAKRYTYFEPVTPAAEECLLVPFYVGGKAVGTIWAVTHDERRKFDAEDQRLLISLGQFASSAYQLLSSNDSLRSEVAERKQTERALRESKEKLRKLATALERQVRVRTRELEQGYAASVQQSEELHELSNRLLKTQDDERRRIARELHDSAGQILTVLGMNLCTMMRQSKEDAALGKTIEDSQELVKQLNEEVRTMSYLLHPPLLEESGLSAAIRVFTQGLMERNNLSIELNIAENFGRLTNELEVTLFRIVQECLTNIHRHSGSKTAAIRLTRRSERVFLEIEDQGHGIPAEKLSGGRAVGVGIMGMRERVRYLNGMIDIHSNGRGTRIAVAFPTAMR